jgi:ribosomal protein S27E
MDGKHIARVGRVDGNAAGGLLLEIFGQDMTGARARCAHCLRAAAVADAVAELDDTGMILLCRGCGRTLLTYLRTGGRAALTIGTLTHLEWDDGLPMDSAVGPAGIEPTTSTV